MLFPKYEDLFHGKDWARAASCGIVFILLFMSNLDIKGVPADWNKENSNQQQNNMNEIYEKCKEEVQIRNNELEKNIPERIKKLKNIPLSRDLYDKFILYYYISEKIIKMNY